MEDSTSLSPALVYVKKREVVAAVLPIDEHRLAMTNLDLLLPPLDFGVFFCYHHPNNNNNYIKKNIINNNLLVVDENEDSSISVESMVNVIKKALSQALVSFYPLAGEIVQNRLGEPEILCNNRGVDFVHAVSETHLHQLDFHRPDLSVTGKLVPLKKHGLLSVQVTELKCGGLVIGCTFDHRVADAHSANLFLKSWANIARYKTTIHPPIFKHSSFNPRNPPRYDPSFDHIYTTPLSNLPRSPPHENLELLQSRMYYIKGEDIDNLQSTSSYINNNNNNNNDCGSTKRTKFESFSSFLWKTIAEGELEQEEKEEDKIKLLKLGIIIDGRKWLMTNNNEVLTSTSSSSSASSCMHDNYFGNVVSIPYTESNVRELKNMQLKDVANKVHACIKSASNKEHFQGLIDWVELRRPERGMVKIYFRTKDEEESMVVSSGLRFPVSEINFGWGKPYFGSYDFPWGGETGYVMPMHNGNREEDWIVYMHLKGKHLDMVEKIGGHVFRPLSSTYLNMEN